MKYFLAILILLLAILSTFSFAQPTTQPAVPVAYTVYLIGDVGAPSLEIQEPTLALLQKQLEASDTASAVIYLGDNIYQKGLPDSAERKRKESEQYLLEQLKITDNFPGQVFFIPGNHDWARSGRKGWERIKNQEYFVENYLKRGNVFLPDMLQLTRFYIWRPCPPTHPRAAAKPPNRHRPRRRRAPSPPPAKHPPRPKVKPRAATRWCLPRPYPLIPPPPSPPMRRPNRPKQRKSNARVRFGQAAFLPPTRLK